MAPVSPTLRGSARPLTHEHDVALLDLDGVVYVGPDAVPGAADVLATARERGLRLAFVTNNAARPPQAVADHLGELGIAARASEIVTSAQAAARYLGDRLPGGARVLVVGTLGLTEALRERGLVPVTTADGPVDAVVQGYSPELDWKQLAEGAIAINRRVPWVATNLDPTVPSPRGPLPGNGSLVAALRSATRTEPVSTGKPDPTMHREMVIRSKAERPIVVGDRLDTDIEGANAVGCPSLLVFTGVTTLADLLDATPALRPTYIAADLTGLLIRHPDPQLDNGTARCGRWTVEAVSAQQMTLTSREIDANRDRGESGPDAGASSVGAGSVADGTAGGGRRNQAPSADDFDDDALDAIRALCVARWNALDEAGEEGRIPSDREHLVVAARDAADTTAAGMVRRLGLAADDADSR